MRGEFTWAPDPRVALDAGVQANWSWARRNRRTYTASPGDAPLVRSTLAIRNEPNAQVARGLTGELFPLLPSAGVLIEF